MIPMDIDAAAFVQAQATVLVLHRFCCDFSFALAEFGFLDLQVRS